MLLYCYVMGTCWGYPGFVEAVMIQDFNDGRLYDYLALSTGTEGCTSKVETRHWDF